MNSHIKLSIFIQSPMLIVQINSDLKGNFIQGDRFHNKNYNITLCTPNNMAIGNPFYFKITMLIIQLNL